jgi:FtsP/CotA-like multicopper oxidase with cupredoxin domain
MGKQARMTVQLAIRLASLFSLLGSRLGQVTAHAASAARPPGRARRRAREGHVAGNERLLEPARCAGGEHEDPMRRRSHMSKHELIRRGLPAALLALFALPAGAQSFRVQCPGSTVTHPAANNDVDPLYTGPTQFKCSVAGGCADRGIVGATTNDGYLVPANGTASGAIKCQQLSGGDGYATMGDGTQTYMFSFGPLSGLTNIASGQPGTVSPSVFNAPYSGTSPLAPGDPATNALTTYNGAVGLAPDPLAVGADGNHCAVNSTDPLCIDGHVDPRQIMDVGVMNGNIPGPLMAVDEDDEFFLTLTNVGMIMRPDLFEQHTVHFHGYPNASSIYDGVPDASVAINIGASFTYYYLAPDAGTYFWHCHITPPEHLQMGMVGQLYVRPRQNRWKGDLYFGLQAQQGDLRTACSLPVASSPPTDILCSNPLPAVNTAKSNPIGTNTYAYNDGDGSTQYDVEYPLQMHGFDPNFHFVGMTFNPEGFTDMKDKYFLLNGRSYPDTVTPGPLQTQSTDGVEHFSQPLPSIINVPAGGKALLRLSNLSVSEYHTLGSLGIPMTVIALNAKLLRDQAGNNLSYLTNSITLGGGESLDVILDASDKTVYQSGQKFYLYTPNLDHLSNDAENFGGMMTEVNVCASVDPVTKACTL